MNELNINIVKDNAHPQNPRISMLSTKEVEVQNRTANVKPYQAVSNFIRQLLHFKKKKWTREVLLELANKPLEFRSIDDLGKSTHLDKVVYPILAKLHRQGLVEARQHKNAEGLMLTYRLTKRGLVHSKEILTSVTP